ncbi:MAG: sirohydrochlorin chelatase [Elusimicrobiota bacterium]
MKCVILVGHGAAPSDYPPEMVSELKRLEFSPHGRVSPRFAELDRHIRLWPRTKKNDPYQDGLNAIARALAQRMENRPVLTAYNEFCAPSLEESFERAVREGAGEITIVSTMYTRGGIHSEDEIPRDLKILQSRHPRVRVRYAWPMSLDAISGFLSQEVARAESSAG